MEREPQIHGDASVNGQDLNLLDESKGWYREVKNGREVQVDEIYVEKMQNTEVPVAASEQA